MIHDREMVLGLFALHLHDTDSYMYLTAINGLATLGDLYPRDTIPVLAHEYSSVPCAPSCVLGWFQTTLT